MSLRVPVLLVLALALALPAAARADDTAKDKLARELMVLTGSADLGAQMMEGMADQFRNQRGIPEGFVDKFLELAKPEGLVEMVVPLYVKTFDEETLQAAVDFYKTPAGKNLVAGLPQITQESMALGKQWGMELAQKTQAALEAAPPAEEPAAKSGK